MKYDIVIVGAGMAGLTAAIYARRAGKSVLVLEAEVPGGQIINTLNIENWPGEAGVSGATLMQKVQKQALDLGAEIEMEKVIRVEKTDGSFVVTTEDDSYECEAVILAVGAKRRKLGLEREDLLIGRGISYCATCDGAFYKGKSVAVIGGGNTALDDALYLSDLAAKVYLVHRRNEFRGSETTVKKLKQRDNVEFVTPFEPFKVSGGSVVNGLVVSSAGITKDGVQALIDPIIKELAVDGIFVAIGQEPATTEFAGLVELDEHGYIVAGEDCKTSCPGVFVAGDCRTRTVRQLVTAAADGAVVIDEALRYLDK